MTKLSITINGRAHGPTDVRDDLSMNDFLREYLGMTGTKFGCGAAQCLSCAVPARNGGRKPEDLIHHIGEDTQVGWAWTPGAGRVRKSRPEHWSRPG